MKSQQQNTKQPLSGNIKNKVLLRPLFNREAVIMRTNNDTQNNTASNNNHSKVKNSEGKFSELTPEQKQALCDQGYQEFCDKTSDDKESETDNTGTSNSQKQLDNRNSRFHTPNKSSSHRSQSSKQETTVTNNNKSSSYSSNTSVDNTVPSAPGLSSSWARGSQSVDSVINATSTLKTVEKEARSKLLKAASDFRTLYLLDSSANLQTKFQSKVMEIYRPVFEAKGNLLKTLLKLPTWVFESGETTKIQLEEELVNVERITSKYIDITAMEGLKYLFLNFRAFAFSKPILDAEPGLKQVEQYLKHKYKLSVNEYSISEGFKKPIASQDRFGIIPLLYFTPRFLKAWSKKLGLDYVTMRYMFYHAPGAENKLYIPKEFKTSGNKLGIEYHSVSITDSNDDLPSAPLHMRKMYDMILQYSTKMKDNVLELYRKSPGYAAITDFIYQIPRTIMVLIYNAYWAVLLNNIQNIPTMSSESFANNLGNNRPADAMDIAAQLYLMDSQYFVKPYAQLREDLKKVTIPLFQEFKSEMEAILSPIVEEIEDENYKLFIGDIIIGNRKAEKRSFFLPALPVSHTWFLNYDDVPNGVILRSPDEWLGKKYFTAGGMAYELDNNGVHLKDQATKTKIEGKKAQVTQFIDQHLSTGRLADRFARFLGHFPGINTQAEAKAAALIQSIFKMMTPKFAAFTMVSPVYIESPTDAVVKQGVLSFKPWFTDYMSWLEDRDVHTEPTLRNVDLDLLVYPSIPKPHVGHSYFRSILEAHQYEGYQQPYTRTALNGKAVTLFQKSLQAHGIGWTLILLYSLSAFLRNTYTFEVKEYTRKLLSMYGLEVTRLSLEEVTSGKQTQVDQVILDQKNQYHSLRTVKTLDWTEQSENHELSVRAYDAIIGTHHWTISLDNNTVAKTLDENFYLLIKRDVLKDSYLSSATIEKALVDIGRKGTLYYGRGTKFVDFKNRDKYFLQISHNDISNLDLATSRRIVLPLTVMISTAKSTVAYVLDTSTHTLNKTYEISDALLHSSNSWYTNLTKREFGNIKDVELTIKKLFGSRNSKILGVERAETGYHPITANPGSESSSFSMPVLPVLTEYSPLLTNMGVEYQNNFGWVSDDLNTDKRMVLEGMIYKYPDYIKVPAKYFDHVITKLEKDGVSFEYTTE